MTPLDWLTLGLVLITGYYAIQTRKTVEEMHAARASSVRPHLVPVVEYDQTGRGSVQVENVGTGPAFDIDLVLTFEPRGTAYSIRRYVLRSGDRRIWNPPRTGQEELHPHPYHPDAQLPHDTDIHLTGRCRDLSGNWHAIDQRTMVLNRWEQVSPVVGKAAEQAEQALQGRDTGPYANT